MREDGIQAIRSGAMDGDGPFTRPTRLISKSQRITRRIVWLSRPGAVNRLGSTWQVTRFSKPSNQNQFQEPRSKQRFRGDIAMQKSVLAVVVGLGQGVSPRCTCWSRNPLRLRKRSSRASHLTLMALCSCRRAFANGHSSASLSTPEGLNDQQRQLRRGRSELHEVELPRIPSRGTLSRKTSMLI